MILTPEQQAAREARIKIMAAMETGNINKAKTELRELAAEQPEPARTLRLDVVAAYGTDIG